MQILLLDCVHWELCYRDDKQRDLPPQERGRKQRQRQRGRQRDRLRYRGTAEGTHTECAVLPAARRSISVRCRPSQSFGVCGTTGPLLRTPPSGWRPGGVSVWVHTAAAGTGGMSLSDMRQRHRAAVWRQGCCSRARKSVIGGPRVRLPAATATISDGTGTGGWMTALWSNHCGQTVAGATPAKG